MTGQPLSGAVPCDFRAKRSSHGALAGRVPLVENLASVRTGAGDDADADDAGGPDGAATIVCRLAGAWLDGESDSLDATVTRPANGEVGNGLAVIVSLGRGAEAKVLVGIARIITAEQASKRAALGAG
jgi:hypothetical protein